MRLARMAAGLLVGVAVLTGCAGKQPANETLPAAAPTTADATPTLPPLGPPDMPMPAEAREQTAAGLDAFVRYYLNLINRTSQVMDPQYLSQFSDGCETCSRIADDTAKDALAGYSYRGGSITVESAAPATVQPPVGEVAFLANQAALSVTDAAGVPVQGLQLKAIPHISSGARARWDAGQSSWILTQLTLG